MDPFVRLTTAQLLRECYSFICVLSVVWWRKLVCLVHHSQVLSNDVVILCCFLNSCLLGASLTVLDFASLLGKQILVYASQIEMNSSWQLINMLGKVVRTSLVVQLERHMVGQ